MGQTRIRQRGLRAVPVPLPQLWLADVFSLGTQVRGRATRAIAACGAREAPDTARRLSARRRAAVGRASDKRGGQSF